MNFAEMLRKELKERDWSIYRLAGLSRVPPSTIKGWLYSGTEPSMTNAQKVAKALGKTVEELLSAAGYVSEGRAACDSEKTPEQVLEDIKLNVRRLEGMLDKQKREDKK